MKRFIIVGCLLLAGIMAGIFYYSGEHTEAPPLQKVGVVMMGEKDDSSWNISHVEGLDKVTRDSGVPVVWREGVELWDAPQVMEELIGEGCRVIIVTSWELEDATLQEAAKYPRVSFLQARSQKEGPNILCYTGRFYQMNYLCGLAAGAYAKSGAIGYVSSVPNPESIRAVDAFAIGVRKVNPEAKVYLRYAGSWTSDSLVGMAAGQLMRDHPEIQVLAGQAGSDGYLEVARQKGIKAIGCNIDQSKKFPETVVTAPLWHWEVIYGKALRETAYARVSSRSYLGGVDSGLFSFLRTPLLHVKMGEGETLESFMEGERQRIVAGYFDAFYGPLRDNQGQLRVPQGENLSDDVLFGSLDWYAEGVQLDD